MTVKVVNKETNQEFSEYLKANYLYEVMGGIIPCDLCLYEYKTGVIDGKPVVYKEQHHPIWYKGRYYIEYLNPDKWEVRLLNGG